jgi:hypothetical protein
MAGPSALTAPDTLADDAVVPIQWLAVSGWGLLLIVLLGAAVLIGLVAARLFLRATDAQSERR